MNLKDQLRVAVQFHQFQMKVQHFAQFRSSQRLLRTQVIDQLRVTVQLHQFQNRRQHMRTNTLQ